jgi:hypothetical protein
MYSVCDDPVLAGPGCPIRKSPDQSLFSGSPKLIAASHVLHRLSTPRHPPTALSSLTISLCLGKLLRTFTLLIHLSKSNEDQQHPRKFLSLSASRSLLTAYGFLSSGGGGRIRTGDPLRAKQALFHLSYTPDQVMRWWA